MSRLAILIAGEAGQGIKTVENMLVKLLREKGYYFFISREYMSRVRGGINSTQIDISNKPIHSNNGKCDLFIALTEKAYKRYKEKFDENTLFIGNSKMYPEDLEYKEMDFVEIAKESGNKKYANSALFGMLSSYINSDIELAKDIIKNQFAQKKEHIEGNLGTLKKAYEMYEGKKISFRSELQKNDKVYDGSLALAHGFVFGGINFIASYPMSPSTGVLTNLSKLSNEYEIIVEQAEDEIAAINMSIGASFGGARPMVTTSGGGFALMSEGISLAGIVETPIVIHLAQRPGPATGLPTRTEQGDFNLALYSGHGDFQRIILAPGSIQECIKCAMDAINLSDKYQIPVIVLTDQYLLDAKTTIPKEDIIKPEIQEYIFKTESDYKRYEITNNGISKRGVPGFGEGVVCLDSDEHDEYGKITEDKNIRIKMVTKRNDRKKLIEAQMEEPTLLGAKNYKKLVVCYGSNLGVCKDLAKEADENDYAFLHFSWLYPIKFEMLRYFKRAKELILLENNYTGQFGKYLEQEFRVIFDKKILKYDGHPFNNDEVANQLWRWEK